MTINQTNNNLGNVVNVPTQKPEKKTESKGRLVRIVTNGELVTNDKVHHVFIAFENGKVATLSTHNGMRIEIE